MFLIWKVPRFHRTPKLSLCFKLKSLRFFDILKIFFTFKELITVQFFHEQTVNNIILKYNFFFHFIKWDPMYMHYISGLCSSDGVCS